jgi:hypothetical protein
MDNMNVLLEPVRVSLHSVGEFLPRVVLAILIVIAGWLIAKALRFALVKALRGINFPVLTEKAGVEAFLRQGGVEFDSVDVLGALFYWLVILAALMVAFNSLGLAYVTELIGRIVLFVPRVMLAILILAFGAYFARFVGTALAAYCRNVGMADAEVLGRLAAVAILAFVILIAIEQLGVGDIIRQTFLVIVAAVAFALALAFGLGGQKRAGELIDRWTRPSEPPAPRDQRPVV